MVQAAAGAHYSKTVFTARALPMERSRAHVSIIFDHLTLKKISFHPLFFAALQIGHPIIPSINYIQLFFIRIKPIY